MKLYKIWLISCMIVGLQSFAYAARNYEKLCADYQKVCENDKCGVFASGHSGPIIYTEIRCLYPNSAPILVSGQPGKWQIYNPDTDSAGTALYEDIQPLERQFLKTKANNKWGLAYIDGTELLPANYEDVAVLFYDYLLAKENNKWKLFYLQGREMKEISAAAYDSIEPAPKYYKGYFVVTVNGKKGVIYLPTIWQEEKANFSYVKPLFDDIILPPVYDFVKVSQGNKWGFYDLKSGELATHLYDDISKFDSFHNDRFKISLQGKQGVLMRNNATKALEEAVAPSYDDVKALTGQRLFAVAENEKWGVYDVKEQKLVLDPAYEDVRGQGSNAVQVLEQGQWVKKQFPQTQK